LAPIVSCTGAYVWFYYPVAVPSLRFSVFFLIPVSVTAAVSEWNTMALNTHVTHLYSSEPGQF